MAFLKINDPSRRDELVKEYYSLRNKIQNDRLVNKLEDQYKLEEAEKLFKPVTESNLHILDNIQAIKSPDDSILNFSFLASKYIPIAQNKKANYDSTFGIHFNSENKMIIGDEPIELKDGYLIIQNQKYKETKGLWELLTKQKPENSLITEEDLENYEDITINSNNLFRDGKVKGNKRGVKYTTYLKPILDKFYSRRITSLDSPRRLLPSPPIHGNGIVVIPCNPNDLVQRMDLLFESKTAGNNNLDSELTAIINAMYKKKIIDKNSHKLLSLKIKQ